MSDRLSMLFRAHAHGRIRRLISRVVAVAMVVASGGVFFVATAVPAHAAITTPFTKVYSTDINGGIQIRGNTIESCQTTATQCATGRNTLTLDDNSFFMTYVDVDNDPTTFDSSSATVDVPSGGSVLYAALVWGGNTDKGAVPSAAQAAQYGTGTAANAPTVANAGQVELMVPGATSYLPVSSSQTSFLSGTSGNYQGFADVTAAVQAAGDGSYTVANVQTATGENIQGGWALVIAYSNPTDPPRNLTIFSGFGTVAATNTVDFAVSGFETPGTGAVKTTLGAVSYEGDAALVGDQMQLGNSIATLRNVTDALHPVANSFTSVISDGGVDSSTRNPKYENQLGFDAATIDVSGFLANGSTTAAIRLTSNAGGETYYPGVVTFATDLYVPSVTATKTVAVVAKAPGNTQAGVAEPGDTLQYTINATNTGQDSSITTVLSDAIPAGTTYQPGSLTSGGATLTDASGDDIGSYDSGTNKVTVNLGTGATATAGGTVNAGDSIPAVTFDAVVDSNITDGSTISNTASLAYVGNQTGIAVSSASNVVTTPAVRHHSDVSITDTASTPVVQKGAGTQVTYTLTASNAGPYDDPGATITDTLPPGAVLVSATPSTGSCTTAATIVCNIGPLAMGATPTVAVVVILDAAADPATDSASIAGTNLDSTTSNNAASVATAVNTAPAAHADSGTTSGGTVTIPVLANDSDVDGDTLSVTAGPTVPTRGSIVVNSNNTITYTATTGELGSDSFDYVVSDGRGGSATATVTVTIPNAAPVATADAASTTPGHAVTISVLDNDTDANVPSFGQVLSVSSVTQPTGSKGTVTTDGATVTFTPSGTFLTGVASFSYTVSDGDGGTDTAAVTVSMPNVAPVAAADTASTPYLTPITVDVLANDSDANGDPLTVTAASGALHGTTSITGSGGNTKILYTPNTGWSGIDSIDYTISDGTTTSTGQLTVTTDDASPTAGNVSVTVNSGVTSTVNVLALASDPNGDVLTVTGAGPGAHGTVGVDSSGRAVYTPASGYTGPDSFDYVVSDGHGGTATGTVSVTVAAPVSPTVAVDDFAIASGQAGSPITIDALANDVGPAGGTITIASVSTPGHGTASVVGGKIVYTPQASFVGLDAFTYSISDGQGGASTGTINVDVQNRSPVAHADSAAAPTAVSTSIDVLANDADPDGEVLSISSVDPTSANGGTEAIAGGVVHYVSAAGFTGTDTFSYVAADPRGGVAGAVVTVTVTNDALVASSRTASTTTNAPVAVDLLNGATDAGGHPITVTSVGSPAHGAVVVDGSGVATYTPVAGFAGTDTFTYHVADGFGGTATATVSVTIADANPTAVNDSFAVNGDGPHTFNVLANDTDPNIPGTSQTLSVVSVSVLSGGATASANAGGVAVSPNPGFVGDVVVQYVISDGAGGTSTAQLLVHVAPPAVVPPAPVTPPVNPVNPVTPVVTPPASPPAHHQSGAPGLQPDRATTPFQAPVTVNVLANDPSSTATILPTSLTTPRDGTGTARGTVVIVDNKLKYVPPAGFAGTVTFNYGTTNPAGGTMTTSVTITVQPRDTMKKSSTETIAVAMRSVTQDPTRFITGAGVEVVGVTQPDHGAAVTVVDGHIVVTRLAGFVGTVHFSYVAVNADGTEMTMAVTVHALGKVLPNSGTLPFTGLNVEAYSLIGLLFLLVGGGALRLGRTRRSDGWGTF